MPTTYQKCDETVRTLLVKLIENYHGHLKAEHVIFDLMFGDKCDADDNPLPAVKLHGVAAAAKVKITSLEDRARGMADAKIVIDRNEWEAANEQTQAAILDHELTHITLRGGENPTDDRERSLPRSVRGRRAASWRHCETAIATTAIQVARK